MMLFKKKQETITDDKAGNRLEARVSRSKIYGKGVTRIYKSKKQDILAIDNVDFEILDNEFVSIVGPSGCGKSTLIKMIGGLDDITSGSIILNDRILDGPGADRGMVFQTYTLFPWMTVEENIRFGLKIKKMPVKEADRIVDKYLELIGLTQFRKSLPNQLSGGMKQRVAIARSLANNPEVLLMDEPFGALDPQTKANMQLCLRQIWQVEKPTIIFITHDIEEAVFLSQRVYVMSSRPGRIIADIPVYLDHKRTLDIKDTPEFIRIRKNINTILHSGLDEDEL